MAFPPQKPAPKPGGNPFGGAPPMGGAPAPAPSGPPGGGMPMGGSAPPPGDPGMQDSPLLQALAATMGGEQMPLAGAGTGDPSMGLEELISMLALGGMGVGGGPDMGGMGGPPPMGGGMPMGMPMGGMGGY